VHFHLPIWLYKALAAIGGVGFLVQQVAKPLLVSMIDKYLAKHDESVWVIVREPRHKVVFWQHNVPFYDTPPKDSPYSLSEIAKRVNRKESSVLRSLKRLEKRGKVKDVHEGWTRA
jgi:predicted Rossmann fold nucleotide-binding protein DprA/Smf involved in DNA uptake